METIDLKNPSNDYFSLRKSSGSSKDSAALDELEKAMKRLEGQLRSLAAEKEKLSNELTVVSSDKDLLAGELKAANTTKSRLEKEATELKDQKEDWEAERAGLIMERDEDRRRFALEKTSLEAKVRDLSLENEHYAENEGLKEAQWDYERAALENTRIQEVQALEKIKSQLEGRIIDVEESISHRVKDCERLEETVSILEREKIDTGGSIVALQQYLNESKAELSTVRAQSEQKLDRLRQDLDRVRHQSEEEKAAWLVERQRLVEESAEEQHRFEEERKSNQERLIALEDELEALEADRKKLDEDVYGLRLEKEETGRTVSNLRAQIGQVELAMEEVRASSEQRITGLHSDLDTLREERDRQLGLKDNYIHSLSENVRELQNELTQTRQTTKEIVSQNDATISQLTAGLTERKRMLADMERERESLREHFIVLGEELELKESEKVVLEHDVADLTKEKDHRGRMIASLQEQLTLAAEEMRIVRDTTSAKVIALEEELRRMREERDQSPCNIM